MASDEYIMAFDYGEKRVGVAVAHSIARLPQPVTTLVNNDSLLDAVAKLVQDERIGRLVVGLPRNMDGSLGVQADRCQEFGAKLALKFNLPVVYADETLSSVSAEKFLSNLKGNGIGLDAVAAAVILERYLQEGEAQLA